MKKFKFVSINEFINKYSDLVLAALVLSVLGMIIVPLPTWMLDILLTVDLAIAVIIATVFLIGDEIAEAFTTVLTELQAN